VRLGVTLSCPQGVLRCVDELAKYGSADAQPVSTPEAYSFDGVVQLGFLVAQTKAGIPYAAPSGSTKEIVEIYRRVWRRDVLAYDRDFYRSPLPSGIGKRLAKIAQANQLPPSRCRPHINRQGRRWRVAVYREVVAPGKSIGRRTDSALSPQAPLASPHSNRGYSE
jgi:hypothetical protein